MFVAEGAQENLRKQRSEAFYHDYVEKMVREAKGLGLTLAQLTDLMWMDSPCETTMPPYTKFSWWESRTFSPKT